MQHVRASIMAYKYTASIRSWLFTHLSLRHIPPIPILSSSRDAMVYLSILDPARGIKQLVQLFQGRSRGHRYQARQIANKPTPSSAVLDYALHGKFTSHSSKDDRASVTVDDAYYVSGEETRGVEREYCTLKMDSTLFKVHKSVLMRDDSVFMDWKFVEGGSLRTKDKSAPIIHLPEKASRFRDLLWALHNLDLEDPGLVYEPSIHRLLNVAEMAHEYRFFSYEDWAVEQLYKTCVGTSLPFSLAASGASSSSITLTENIHPEHTDVDSLCARLLHIAYTSRHSPLLLAMMKKLVVQTLWHDYHPGPTLVSSIETLSRRRSRYQRHVQQLLGVIYYRMLVDMRYTHASDHSVVLFPPAMDVERRMRFLSAHQALTDIWADLKEGSPPVSTDERHATCQTTWERHWQTATRRAQLNPCDCKPPNRCRAGHRKHTADVLGMLKTAMMYVRRSIADSKFICVECSLTGLESIDMARDDIINNLGDLFED